MAMNRRISDDELLGFIEGDLPAQRMLDIERALRADGGLAATLDAMRRDRVMLRAEFADMFAQAGGKAPHRTVQEAIEAAEREAILADVGTARSTGVLARIGANRGLAIAASTALLLTAGGLIWNTTRPTQPRQIGAQRAAEMMGAESAVIAMDPQSSGDQLALANDPGSGISDKNIENALQLAQNAESQRDELRSFSRPASAVPAAMRSWNDLHSEALVLPTRSPVRIANDLPLSAVVEALDRSRIDWSQWDNEVLTLAVAGRDRSFTRARFDDFPEASPASYEDALRLAALNRLSLRVVADDPSAVEQELFRLADRNGTRVRLNNRGDACGALEYSIEMPRTKGDMEALIDAVCGCDAGQIATRQTFFDVSLLPADATPESGRSTASQVTGGLPRVSVPVLIERRAER
jgi:hypothetical protein